MISLEPFSEEKIPEIIKYLKFKYKKHKRKSAKYLRVSFNCSIKSLHSIDCKRGRMYRSVYLEDLISNTDRLPEEYAPYPRIKVTSVNLTPGGVDKLEKLAYDLGVTRSEALERLMLFGSLKRENKDV